MKATPHLDEPLGRAARIPGGALFRDGLLPEATRPSAVLIAAWSSGAGELLTTEGARRRMRIELERRPDRDADEERADATVTALRTRLEGR